MHIQSRQFSNTQSVLSVNRTANKERKKQTNLFFCEVAEVSRWGASPHGATFHHFARGDEGAGGKHGGPLHFSTVQHLKKHVCVS